MTEVRTVRPEYWTDHNGHVWIVPQIKGRLKMKIPSHRALREFVIHHPDNMQCLCHSCNSRKAGLVDAKGIRHGAH